MKILIVLGLIAVAFATKSFVGDQVLTLHPKNEIQAELLRHLNDESEYVDFWNPAYPNQVRPGHSVDIRIPSVSLPFFKTLMRRNRLDFEVKISDVQTVLDDQKKGRGILGGGDYDYNIYHTYDEINTWVSNIANDYAGLATRFYLGTSFEGRDIPILKISTSDTNPAMLVDCGFHAREWISPAFCQCYVKKLVEGYGSDSSITDTLNQLTIYVVPSVNVDGYAYTWTNDRMWRKTRSTGNSLTCVGVDPNRNCDAGFGGEGASPLACSDTYHGPEAESEDEVKALSNFIRANVPQLKAYVTFHAYGQMILYPYSYTYDLAATTDNLDYYGTLAQTAVKQKYRTRYVMGPGATTIYPAAGGSDDFAYDAGVPLSYTIELRDKGTYGFALPANQIQFVCEETYDLMEVMQNAAIEVANGVVRP